MGKEYTVHRVLESTSRESCNATTPCLELHDGEKKTGASCRFAPMSSFCKMATLTQQRRKDTFQSAFALACALFEILGSKKYSCIYFTDYDITYIISYNVNHRLYTQQRIISGAYHIDFYRLKDHVERQIILQESEGFPKRGLVRARRPDYEIFWNRPNRQSSGIYLLQWANE